MKADHLPNQLINPVSSQDSPDTRFPRTELVKFHVDYRSVLPQAEYGFSLSYEFHVTAPKRLTSNFWLQ